MAAEGGDRLHPATRRGLKRLTSLDEDLHVGRVSVDGIANLRIDLGILSAALDGRMESLRVVDGKERSVEEGRQLRLNT